MHVGIIIHGYPPEMPGGAELQAKILASKLAEHNHQVTVFAGSKKNELLQESDHMRVFKIRYADRWLLRLFLSQLIALLPRIRKEARHLDVLLCYQVNPPGIVGLAAKAAFGIPLVTCVRADSEYKYFLRKYFFTPLLIALSNRFLVQTSKIKTDINQVPFYRLIFSRRHLEKIKVISNGIEIQRPKQALPERKGVVFVGRLHRVKGIEFLIKAMENIDARLSIIGKGEDEERLKKLSQGMKVDFLGELPHHKVLEHLSRSRVFVLPSLGEALPNVILEAMSTGLPVVASDVGGIADIIHHGETGFLVKPGKIRKIESFIKRLLQDDELWHKMSRQCLVQVEKYDWRFVVQSYEETFGDVVSRAK